MNIYKSLYREIVEDLTEKRHLGKEALAKRGITFSTFKSEVALLLVVAPDTKVNYYELFNTYCYMCSDNENLSIEDFANSYYLKFDFSTHGIRLKNQPDSRL